MQNRQTKQKKILREEISCMPPFFTAQELHERISKKDSRIGIATVYRFLNEMHEQNKLHQYVCERKQIYATEDKAHVHFLCQKCKTLIHLDLKSIDFLKKQTPGTICHFQISIEGVCKNCQK